MVKFIIFSKDRPAQLDLLLRSIDEFYPECNYTIIWKATNENAENGYYKIWQYCDFHVEQTELKFNILQEMTEYYTAFLVDDMVFVDRFRAAGEEYYQFLSNPNIACLSLRMDKHVTYSYTKDCQVTPPASVVKNNLWSWVDNHFSYWNYPMSLDGHIFRTADIKPIIERLDFETPNQLEGQLAQMPIDRPLMICYPERKVVNIPLNVVQTDCKSRSMGISADLLNDSFLAGHRLKLPKKEELVLNACHIEIMPQWI